MVDVGVAAIGYLLLGLLEALIAMFGFQPQLRHRVQHWLMSSNSTSNALATRLEDARRHGHLRLLTERLAAILQIL